MKVNTNWTMGNFAVALETEVTEAQAATLQALGLRYLGQRNSEVDKVLGGFETNAEGKSTRRAGFKRNDVEFTETLASALEPTFADLGDGIIGVAVIGKAEVKEGTDGFAGARKLYVNKGGDKARLQKLADAVDYEGEIGDGKEAPAEFLTAIKAWLKG